MSMTLKQVLQAAIKKYGPEQLVQDNANDPEELSDVLEQTEDDDREYKLEPDGIYLIDPEGYLFIRIYKLIKKDLQ